MLHSVYTTISQHSFENCADRVHSTIWLYLLMKCKYSMRSPYRDKGCLLTKTENLSLSSHLNFRLISVLYFWKYLYWTRNQKLEILFYLTNAWLCIELMMFSFPEASECSTRFARAVVVAFLLNESFFSKVILLLSSPI